MRANDFREVTGPLSGFPPPDVTISPTAGDASSLNIATIGLD
jgi:hypothetical protein